MALSQAEMRIMLDGEDFGVLVRGGIVSKVKLVGVTGPYIPIKIMLADVGFERMEEAIVEAKEARGAIPPRQWKDPQSSKGE